MPTETTPQPTGRTDKYGQPIFTKTITLDAWIFSGQYGFHFNLPDFGNVGQDEIDRECFNFVDNPLGYEYFLSFSSVPSNDSWTLWSSSFRSNPPYETWSQYAARKAANGLALTEPYGGYFSNVRIVSLTAPRLVEKHTIHNRFPSGVVEPETGTTTYHYQMTAVIEYPAYYFIRVGTIQSAMSHEVSMPGHHVNIAFNVSFLIPNLWSNLYLTPVANFYYNPHGYYSATTWYPEISYRSVPYYVPDFMMERYAGLTSSDPRITQAGINSGEVKNLWRDITYNIQLAGHRARLEYDVGFAYTRNADPQKEELDQSDPLEMIGICVNQTRANSVVYGDGGYRMEYISPNFGEPFFYEEKPIGFRALEPMPMPYDYAVVIPCNGDSLTHGVVWFDLPQEEAAVEFFVVAITQKGRYFIGYNATSASYQGPVLPQKILRSDHSVGGRGANLYVPPLLTLIDVEHHQLICGCMSAVIDDSAAPPMVPKTEILSGQPVFWRDHLLTPTEYGFDGYRAGMNIVQSRLYDDPLADLVVDESDLKPQAMLQGYTGRGYEEICSYRWSRRDNGQVRANPSFGCRQLYVKVRQGINPNWWPLDAGGSIDGFRAMAYYMKPGDKRNSFDGTSESRLYFYNALIHHKPWSPPYTDDARIEHEGRSAGTLVATLEKTPPVSISVLCAHLWGDSHIHLTDGMSGCWVSQDSGETFQEMPDWVPAFPDGFWPLNVVFLNRHALCWGALALEVPDFPVQVLSDDTEWPEPASLWFNRTFDGGVTWEEPQKIHTFEKLVDPEDEHYGNQLGCALYSTVLDGYGRLFIAHGARLRWVSDGGGQADSWREILPVEDSNSEDS